MKIDLWTPIQDYMPFIVAIFLFCYIGCTYLLEPQARAVAACEKLYPVADFVSYEKLSDGTEVAGCRFRVWNNTAPIEIAKYIRIEKKVPCCAGNCTPREC
jgi:hypothetical protein